MMDSVLEISHLSGGYLAGEDILHDISLKVSPGETVGIIGLNGSGKSSLGRALMNLLPYRSGSIEFVGKPVDGLSTHELSRLGIAMMYQGGSVFRNLSVRDNLRLAFDGLPSSERRRLVSKIPLLERSGGKWMFSGADKLSGGERQALSLAMVLARNPRLLILDEPSAGLSPGALEETYQLLEEVREDTGLSIILIEQNVTRAVSFSDRCLLMESGRLVSDLTNMSINEIESLLFNND